MIISAPTDYREAARRRLPPFLFHYIDGGAFAVTAGRVEDWGLADVSQAWLVGSPNQTILDLPKTLRATSPCLGQGSTRHQPAGDANTVSTPV